MGGVRSEFFMPKRGYSPGRPLDCEEPACLSVRPGSVLRRIPGRREDSLGKLPIWESGPHEKENSERTILVANAEYT